MFGEFDTFANVGSDKELVQELAIRNLIDIASNPKFEEIVGVDEIKTIKDYLTLYVKYSTLKMKNQMVYMQENYDEAVEHNKVTEENKKRR